MYILDSFLNCTFALRDHLLLISKDNIKKADIAILDGRMARKGRPRSYQSKKARKENLPSSMSYLVINIERPIDLSYSSVHYEDFNKRLDGMLMSLH